MNKHTPGPWSIHKEPGSIWPLVMAGGPAGRIVANINPESCPDKSSAPSHVVMPANANARLISAAPELLESLGELVDAMGRYECDVDGDVPAHHGRMMARARAAIAKASGN
jgi:hypothetical protein